MEILSGNPEETEKFAKELASRLRPGDVVALYGNLGAGKTTFVSMAVKALGFEARVQSPTFVVSRIYSRGGSASEITFVNHLDLYRLQTPAEIQDLGLADYFSGADSVTFIEWPEIAEEFLPENTIKIRFEILEGDGRKIDVQNLR